MADFDTFGSLEPYDEVRESADILKEIISTQLPSAAETEPVSSPVDYSKPEEPSEVITPPPKDVEKAYADTHAGLSQSSDEDEPVDALVEENIPEPIEMEMTPEESERELLESAQESIPTPVETVSTAESQEGEPLHDIASQQEYADEMAAKQSLAFDDTVQSSSIEQAENIEETLAPPPTDTAEKMLIEETQPLKGAPDKAYTDTSEFEGIQNQEQPQVPDDKKEDEEVLTDLPSDSPLTEIEQKDKESAYFIDQTKQKHDPLPMIPVEEGKMAPMEEYKIDPDREDTSSRPALSLEETFPGKPPEHVPEAQPPGVEAREEKKSISSEITDDQALSTEPDSLTTPYADTGSFHAPQAHDEMIDKESTPSIKTAEPVATGKTEDVYSPEEETSTAGNEIFEKETEKISETPATLDEISAPPAPTLFTPEIEPQTKSLKPEPPPTESIASQPDVPETLDKRDETPQPAKEQMSKLRIEETQPPATQVATEHATSLEMDAYEKILAEARKQAEDFIAEHEKPPYGAEKIRDAVEMTKQKDEPAARVELQAGEKKTAPETATDEVDGAIRKRDEAADSEEQVPIDKEKQQPEKIISDLKYKSVPISSSGEKPQTKQDGTLRKMFSKLTKKKEGEEKR